ncbi:MAG: hypothetical protein KAI79_03770 [Bacteroidales bacterium]|nr:hypothetical protein [Bacteroidales bacterium]
MIDSNYLANFLDPIEEKSISNAWDLSGSFFHTENNMPDSIAIANCQLFFLGVSLKTHKKKNAFCTLRKELYKLSLISNLKFCDLGDIKANENKSQVIAAYKTLHCELTKQNRIVLVLSDSDEIAFEHYQVYEKQNININLATIDKQINIYKSNATSQFSYLGKILNSKHNITDFTAIATQEYFIQEEEKKILKKNAFTEIGLGKIKSKINRMEPSLREANVINYNLQALQSCIVPSIKNTSPNGLDVRDACITSGYIGASDKLKSTAIYPYHEDSNSKNQTTKLLAQIIWYFLKNYSEKIIEIPNENDLKFTKYVVNYNNNNTTISFYKSNISNRWWIEFLQHNKTSAIFPCNYEEYQMAINNQIPDEWINYFNKISKNAEKK